MTGKVIKGLLIPFMGTGLGAAMVFFFSNTGTIAFSVGFVLMMILDVALG